MGFLQTKVSPSKINSSQEDLQLKIAEAKQLNSDNQVNRVRLIQTYRNLKRVAYPFVFMKPDQVHDEIVGKNPHYNDEMPDARPVFGFTRQQVNQQAAHTARPVLPAPTKFQFNESNRTSPELINQRSANLKERLRLQSDQIHNTMTARRSQNFIDSYTHRSNEQRSIFTGSSRNRTTVNSNAIFCKQSEYIDTRGSDKGYQTMY